MPRSCTVCSHAERSAIDRALVDGESFRNIAERFGLSATAIFRHKADHLPAHLVDAQDAADAADADDLLEQARKRQARAERLVSIAEGLIGRALQGGNVRTAVSGVQAATSASREVRECLTLLAKLRGELDERPQVNILLDPQWQTLVVVLRRTLAPHPLLLAEVSQALEAAARAAA
jgi:hypothetical protein